MAMRIVSIVCPVLFVLGVFALWAGACWVKGLLGVPGMC